MSAPPGEFRPALDAAVSDLAMQVDRDTVLQARAVLLGEADRLWLLIQREFSRNGGGVGLCGGDPVSPDAAAGFNERIDAMRERCTRYCQDLREAAGALDAVARSYGHTEEQISASYRNMG